MHLSSSCLLWNWARQETINRGEKADGISLPEVQTATAAEVETTVADSSFASFINLFNNQNIDLPEWAIESFLNEESIGDFTPKEGWESSSANTDQADTIKYSADPNLIHKFLKN